LLGLPPPILLIRADRLRCTRCTVPDTQRGLGVGEPLPPGVRIPMPITREVMECLEPMGFTTSAVVSTPNSVSTPQTAYIKNTKHISKNRIHAEYQRAVMSESSDMFHMPTGASYCFMKKSPNAHTELATTHTRVMVKCVASTIYSCACACVRVWGYVCVLRG